MGRWVNEWMSKELTNVFVMVIRAKRKRKEREA